MKNRTSMVAILILAFAVLGCSFIEKEFEEIKKTASPLETYRKFTKSIQTDDTELVKFFLSKDSIKMMEKSAKNQGLTLDQLLLRGKVKRKYVANLRNEKINGDTATLEEQNDFYKKWETVHMVHENGGWKYAVDVTMEERRKKLNDR